MKVLLFPFFFRLSLSRSMEKRVGEKGGWGFGVVPPLFHPTRLSTPSSGGKQHMDEEGVGAGGGGIQSLSPSLDPFCYCCF